MRVAFSRFVTAAALATSLTSAVYGQTRPTAYTGPVTVPSGAPLPPNSGNVGQPLVSHPGYQYASQPPAAPTVVVQPSTSVPAAGFYPGYFGPRFGVGGALAGYGQTLQGFASTIQATGQYQQDIQQSKIIREQARQESLVTNRKALEHEWWYENKMLQSANRLRDAERSLAIDRARKDPPREEITNGTSLNVLLKSILTSPAPGKGPYLSLEPDTVRGLNLTDGSGRGSLALAKDEGKIEWTEVLEGSDFDAYRKPFEENFKKAIKSTQYGEAPDRETLKELRADHKAMVDRLDSQVASLSPSGWIDSRKVLNKLKDTIKGLSDPKLVKSHAAGSKQSIRTVSDLVEHCRKNGLEFGPAASLSETAAYQAAFYAMRAYERDLVQVAAR